MSMVFEPAAGSLVFLTGTTDLHFRNGFLYRTDAKGIDTGFCIVLYWMGTKILNISTGG